MDLSRSSQSVTEEYEKILVWPMHNVFAGTLGHCGVGAIIVVSLMETSFANYRKLWSKVRANNIKIPQANAARERLHLTMVEMLRTQDVKLRNGIVVKEEVRRLLQSVAFAIQTSNNLVTKHSPAHPIYGCDVIIRQKELANWEMLWERKTKKYVKENEREKKGRSNHKYILGDKVLVFIKCNQRGGKVT